MSELGFDFLKIGYSGILSDSFAVIWCDNDYVFRRLLRFRDTLKEKFSNSGGEIYHIFRADGVYYRAVITRLVNNDIMCRIFPATEKTKLANSLIFNSSADICHNALNILNLTDNIKKCNRDSLNENVSLLSSCAERIYDCGLDIMRCCCSDKGKAYILLKKYIFDTFYRLQSRIKYDNKRICPVIDISATYVKIDYNPLEIAILNMLKLYYVIGDDDDCVLAISDNNMTLEKTISVQCSFKTGKCFREEVFKSTGRTIKSLFISMNGIVKLKRNNDRIDITGSVPVKVRKANNNSEEDEMLFLNREVWEQNEYSDEHIKLYHHSNGNTFRMNVTDFEDIEEKDNISSVLGFLYDKK